MTYTPEITEKLVSFAKIPLSTEKITLLLNDLGAKVNERSVIAKLSSLGLYTRKPYLTKRGELPVPKSVYIRKIGQILQIPDPKLQSLEKVSKNVLAILVTKLEK